MAGNGKPAECFYAVDRNRCIWDFLQMIFRSSGVFLKMQDNNSHNANNPTITVMAFNVLLIGISLASKFSNGK